MSEWDDINVAMDAAAQIGRDDGPVERYEREMWCDQSGRVLPGRDWMDHNRMACPACGKRVTVVAGRVPQHRPPEDREDKD